MELRVHGSIFFLLKKFVVHHYSDEMWNQLVKEAHPSCTEFEMTKNYPLSDIESIVSCASEHSGYSVNQLKEMFGEWLVPDLFKIYSSYLNPDWKTLDVLEHTEVVMHGAVRKLNSTANPPILNVLRVSDTLTMIDYHSKRKMGSLAVGIIRGIANYYNEAHLFRIFSTTDPDAERVQIKVETVTNAAV